MDMMATKERPMLMSAPMVRAILAGTKTQTRRLVKPQPYVDPMGNACWNGSNYGQDTSGRPLFQPLASPIPSSRTKRVHCPYGRQGDRLWVREAWAEVARAEPRTAEDEPWREDGRILVYAADPHWHGSRQFLCSDGVLRWARPSNWRPSIHMPRWASRITLEITGVRVERLQDISEADAEAEGIDFLRSIPDADETLTARELFECLWESINSDGSWAANPWVWVVEFKRIA